MNRALMNLLIDTVAAALLTAMVGTGYILWFALPPGTNRTHSLWGLLRHQFGTLHFWISVTSWPCWRSTSRCTGTGWLSA
jgi:hypothetical protein